MKNASLMVFLLMLIFCSFSLSKKVEKTKASQNLVDLSVLPAQPVNTFSIINKPSLNNRKNNLAYKLAKFKAKYKFKLDNSINIKQNYGDQLRNLNIIAGKRIFQVPMKRTEIKRKLSERGLSKYLFENVNDIDSKDIFYDFNIKDLERESLDNYPKYPKLIYNRSNHNKHSYFDIITAENEFFAKLYKKHKGGLFNFLRQQSNFQKPPSKKLANSRLSTTGNTKNKMAIDTRYHFYTIPYALKYKKIPYISLLDVSSRGFNSWVCSDKNLLFRYKYNDQMDKITSENNDNATCKKITTDSTGVPYVVDKKDKVAYLQKVYNSSFVWRYLDICAADITCGFNPTCYYIPCDSDTLNSGYIMAIEGDKLIHRSANLTPVNMKGYENFMTTLNSADDSDSKNSSSTKLEDLPAMKFTRIACGLGKNGDVIYLVSDSGDLWKFESNYWNLLDSFVTDVAISDRNDLFYSTDKGVFVWERDRLEPRMIFKGNAVNIAAGKKLMVHTKAGVLYTSVDNIS